jgi:2'-5' RNA ligase
VLEAGAAARGQPFSLVLDRLGAFRRAGVAWAGASTVDPALLQLQGRLAVALDEREFTLEARPFNPHVTLVRKVERPLRDETVEPVAWRVTDFTLMRSDLRTGRYETVERWPLDAA